MSRIGKKPVAVLDGVKVSVSGRTIHVEGPQGKLSWDHHPAVPVRVDGGEVHVERQDDERLSKSLHGLTRSLVANMIEGVKKGYEKRLEVIGVGYVLSLQGKTLAMRVGYANEIKKTIPEGLKVTCPEPTKVVIQGCDKQKVGQFAAELRAVRKPEPYKGKGVRYQGEFVKIKAGKAAQ